jgi:methylmalonyl-CoA mutase
VFASTNKKDVKLDSKWETLAAKELKGKDVKDTLVRETNEQMLVKPLYTQADWTPPTSGQAEVPGVFPFKRGPYATMYTHRPWTVR